jgi:hypothetical protein
MTTTNYDSPPHACSSLRKKEGEGLKKRTTGTIGLFRNSKPSLLLVCQDSFSFFYVLPMWFFLSSIARIVSIQARLASCPPWWTVRQEPRQ